MGDEMRAMRGRNVMATHDELYELAIRALDDFHRDRSITMHEIRSGLVSLREHLDTLIDSIPEGEEDTNDLQPTD